VHVGASAAGVYHIALAKADLSDASAAWYDEYVVILSATGAAFETFVIEGVRTDTSAISNFLSNLSAIASDIYSALTGGGTVTVSNISDIASAVWGFTTRGLTTSLVTSSDLVSKVWAHATASDMLSTVKQTGSRVVLVQSRLSDLDSRLVSDVSDILSAIAAGGGTLTVSNISDIASAVWGVKWSANSVASSFGSAFERLLSGASDAASAAQQGNSRVLLVQSRLSDFDSRLVSDISDIRSAIATTPSAVWATALATKLVQLNPSDLSDLRSAITGVVATLSVSDISDIASAVRATLVSDLSDILSAAVQTNSRVLLVQSRLSDLDSRLVSDVSDIRSAIATTPSAVWATALATKLVQLNPSDLSDLRSAIAGVTAAVSASDMSDIASQVWATAIGTRVDSRIALIQSTASDAASGVSDLRSLLTTTGILLDASTMSDIRSAITAGGGAVTVSNISDIASAVWAFHWTGNSLASSFGSAFEKLLSGASDAMSAAQQGNSRILLVQSRLSDLDSRLMSDVSDILSAIAVGGGTVTVSNISDIASAVWATPLATKLVQLNTSDLSDLRSAITAGPAGVLTVSDISDIASAVWATPLATKLVQLNTSDLSDLRSAIAAVTAAVSASDMSDIASRVWATAIGARVDSRIALIQSTASDAASGVSDLRSLLTTTGILLDASTMSDLRSAITAGAGAVTVSNISDIASAIWAFHWTGNSLASSFGSAFEKLLSGASDAASAAQQGNSRILLVQSRLSDLDSRLVSDVSDLRSAVATTPSAVWATALATKLVTLNPSDMSDLRSAITGATFSLGASDLSDIASAVRTVVSSDLSDILSATRQANSRALVLESDTSNIYSLLSNLDSDIQSRFPATIPELTGDPGATPTWAQAEALQYMWLKNSSKTTTTKRVLRTATGTAVLSAAMADNGTSFVQGVLAG
jgi:DNA-directed RNA polymerase subunit F